MNIVNSISFKQDDCILDIGCGDGRVTHEISLLVPKGQVIGIDTSSSMVEEAKKLTTSKSNLSFFKKGAEDFRLNAKFDYILSFHSLHWISDKNKMFRNVFNHLKLRGKFIFVTAGRENPNISKVFSSERWRNKISKHGQKFQAGDPNQINQMLIETGFSIDSFKSEYRSTFYASKEDLASWTMTWIPYATGLGSEESAIFAQEISENLQKQSVKDGIKDRIEFKTEMLIVTCQVPHDS
jgi:trans-aconitate methyltransferase